jgi:hypothetical protein
MVGGDAIQDELYGERRHHDAHDASDGVNAARFSSGLRFFFMETWESQRSNYRAILIVDRPRPHDRSRGCTHPRLSDRREFFRPRFPNGQGLSSSEAFW